MRKINAAPQFIPSVNAPDLKESGVLMKVTPGTNKKKTVVIR